MTPDGQTESDAYEPNVHTVRAGALKKYLFSSDDPIHSKDDTAEKYESSSSDQCILHNELSVHRFNHILVELLSIVVINSSTLTRNNYNDNLTNEQKL